MLTIAVIIISIKRIKHKEFMNKYTKISIWIHNIKKVWLCIA